MTQATGRDELDDFAADVGWSILDVDRFVERRSPPDDALVLEGRFDADRIDEAMGERDGGVWQVGDPGGGLDLDEQTPARRTGEPLWQSLDGDRLVVTGSAEGMEAARRGGSTLADDPILRPLAQALDGEDVYTAMLFGSPLPAPVEVLIDGDATRERIEEACAHALAETPAGVATGVTHDGGPVVVIALLHAGEAAAQANAEALPRLVEEGRSFVSELTWRELFTVDRVTVEGTTTVARLRLREDANLRAWQTVIETRDSLVSAC
jgi:hypothetical protein